LVTYSISPLDTWFFRDGRPFNMNESNQVDLRSIFPPSAHTVVGAIRASLARAMGWAGQGRWLGDIEYILGNGRENLGQLRFHGPYIHSEKHGGLLLPTPLHLLGKPPKKEDKLCPSKKKDKTWLLATLSPEDPVDCDLGEGVCLPSARNIEGFKTLRDYYLTVKDFEVLLAGGDPKDIHPISRKELWDLEYWVGLKRNPFTLTTEDRALFSKRHVRLAPGVSLIMQLDGPDGLAEIEPIIALGGESRMAQVQIIEKELKFPARPNLESRDGSIKFTITNLTPVLFEGSWPGPRGQIKRIPGEVVSACLERPLFLGGWDSLRGKHGEPLPLRPYVPAGSIWFCEANTEDLDLVKLLHRAHIGEEVNPGFGQVAVGMW